MRNHHALLYVHIIWATWDRLPLIEESWEGSLHHALQKEAKAMQCEVCALNGTNNHIHILLQIPTKLSVADLVKQLKGASAFFVNDTLRPNCHFKWQGGYSVFSVSRWDMKNIINYIQNQKIHHNQGTTKNSLELFLNVEE